MYIIHLLQLLQEWEPLYSFKTTVVLKLCHILQLTLIPACDNIGWPAEGTILLLCQQNKVSHVLVMSTGSCSMFSSTKCPLHNSTQFFPTQTLSVIPQYLQKPQCVSCVMLPDACWLTFNFMGDGASAAWKERRGDFSGLHLALSSINLRRCVVVKRQLCTGLVSRTAEKKK